MQLYLRTQSVIMMMIHGPVVEPSVEPSAGPMWRAFGPFFYLTAHLYGLRSYEDSAAPLKGSTGIL